jgi:hypothetical protein
MVRDAQTGWCRGGWLLCLMRPGSNQVAVLRTLDAGLRAQSWTGLWVPLTCSPRKVGIQDVSSIAEKAL